MKMIDIMDIQVGKTVCFYGKPYRILAHTDDCAVMIELAIEKYNIEEVNIKYLFLMDIEEVHPIEDTYGVVHGDPSDEEMKLAGEKQDMIERILTSLSFDYKILQNKKTIPGFGEYRKMFKCSVPTAHKHIRHYLQSGKDVYALLDQRKCRGKIEVPFFNECYRGNHNLSDGTKREKIDPETEKKYFEEAFRWLKSGTCLSVSQAFQMMLRHHYLTLTYGENNNLEGYDIKPKNQLPSEKRFRRYVQMEINNVPLKVFKAGSRKKRNDHRIQYGNAQTGVFYPGQCVEIDACELDLEILSSILKSQDIGRAVVYFAVDVYSGCIIGFYVGLENNSFLGATSLFSNMFFHKRSKTREDGIEIVPGNIIPNTIRVDHGAEWVSQDLRNLQRMAHINVSIVPPGMGSMKGYVENSFHVYQETIRALGKNYGAIYKEYESRHYDKASLILEEIREDVENFVEYFNTQVRPGYTLNKDMISKKVRAIPCELFHYGIHNVTTPRAVTDANKKELLFSLCKGCNKRTGYYPKVSLKGVEIKGLHYISEDTEIIKFIESVHFKTCKVKYEVRIDPRSVDHIWIRLDKELYQLSLSKKREQEMTFAGLTWYEYDLIYSHKKADEREYLPVAEINKLLLEEKTENIMKRAKKEKEMLPKNSKKNIREARQVEKLENRRNEALTNYEIFDQQEKLLQIPVKAEAEISDGEKEPWEDIEYDSYEDYF